MSNRALTWAFDQPITNAGRKFILVALADKADESNSCWPLQETLASMTGQSIRSVREHLRNLEDAGFVSRTARRRGGHRGSDRYTLPVSVAVGLRLPAKSAGSQAANLAGSQAAESAGSLPADLAKPTGRSRRVNPHKNPKKNSSSSAKPPTRPEVERLCTLLADEITANGCKRPTPGVAWRDAARLMIDRDGRTEEQIAKAIKWCQADEFWRANIQSMPTLRAKYETLRLQAQRQHREQAKAAPAVRSISPTRAEHEAQQAALAAADVPWKVS